LNTEKAKVKRQKGKVRILSSAGPNRARRVLTFAFCLFTFAFSSCRQDMHDQPKYRPLRPVDQIGSINDGRSARPLVEGTVARDQLKEDVEFYTGKLKQGAQTSSVAPQPGLASSQAGQTSAQTYQGFVTEFPMPITAADLDRGQERFNIFCAVCHGRLGDGEGMIVKRGFRKPPSYHDERLRNAPIGYFFDVETNGFGAMPDYASQIPPDDRWRIIAYIRALQLSQRGTIADVPPGERDKLSAGSQQPGAEKQGEHQQ
jgi:mono/diheme cytochrome c family protein